MSIFVLYIFYLYFMNIHYVTTHYNNNTLNGGSDFTPVLKLYMFKMSISIAIILKALTQLRYFFKCTCISDSTLVCCRIFECSFPKPQRPLANQWYQTKSSIKYWTTCPNYRILTKKYSKIYRTEWFIGKNGNGGRRWREVAEGGGVRRSRVDEEQGIGGRVLELTRGMDEEA